MQEEVQRWMKQANKDFKAAKKNVKIKEKGVAVFLCQQAVEKSLKASWIFQFHIAAPKTHDLVFLAKRVELPDKFNETLKLLTLLYIETRYPPLDENKKILAKDVTQFIRDTKEMLKWIKKKVS